MARRIEAHLHIMEKKESITKIVIVIPSITFYSYKGAIRTQMTQPRVLYLGSTIAKISRAKKYDLTIITSANRLSFGGRRFIKQSCWVPELF